MLPYPRSLLDLAFDWIAGLPGPTWLAYLVLLLPGIALTNSALWASGLLPLGQLDPTQAFWGIATVGILAASHRLKNVAGEAFDTFQPALGHGVGDPARARYELTVTPARPILLIALFSVAVTPLYYAIDPVASQVVGHTLIGLIPRAISEIAVSIVLLGILVQAIRQMRIVSRLHAAAELVDPFRPAPLYAFSRLTSEAGIVLIGFNSVAAFANPAIFESEAAFGLYVPWLAAFTLVAVAVFVVPLLGMHRRLAAEKDRMAGAADGRLRDLLGELNVAIDARETERVEGLDRTISALRHERDILAKLPTWPWSAGTIRGFGSALLLPITVFLLQRLLLEILPA